MGIKESLSFNLKKVLSEHNIKQNKLAEMTGIKAQNISSYIRGNSTPDLATIISIAEKLGVSIDWLVGRNEVVTRSGDKLSECIRTADMLNAGIIRHKGEGEYLRDLISLEFGRHIDSEHSARLWAIEEFLDAWASYRELYEDGKITKQDYDILISSKLEKIKQRKVTLDHPMLDDYVEKVNALPF